MFGACGDHCFVGGGYGSISWEGLALLLFPCVDGKGEAQVDAGMEISHVVIQIRLADLSVGGEDVHDNGAKIDGIESFGGVVKNGAVVTSITAVNWSCVMLRTILYVFHDLRAVALVAHSSLCLAVVAPAGITG